MKKPPKHGILFSLKDHFLKKCSKLLKLASACFVFFLCAFQLIAQDHQVSGRVTDIDGEPLPGVNVLVEGTTIGTITQPDGSYKITTPSPASALVFSFIGYSREVVAIEERSVIDVTLISEFRAIEEIVVVGYGTRLREELTGSVSTMSAEKIELSAAPSALGRLQGQVSGVHIVTSNVPGGQASIRIRGLGTITDNEPLYIIDGVPSGPGNNLNPNDIESISILKDASSTSIYGTRGANGVVIITTKRGREDQRPTVSFSARSGIAQATNKYDLLNTQEFGELLFMGARNMGRTPGVDWSHPQYGNGTEPRIPDYILPAGTMAGDPAVNPDLYDYPSYLIMPANKEGTNWFDEIFRNALMHEYDMAVSGGAENLNYAFSGSYLREEGLLNHTGFERYTFRANTDAGITDFIKAGQSLQVSYNNQHGTLSGYGGDHSEASAVSFATFSLPIVPVYDIMGNFAGTRAPETGAQGNPVAKLYRERHNVGGYFRMLGNFYGEASIIEGLDFRSTLGYNYGQWNGRNRTLVNPEHSEPDMTNVLNRSNNYTFQWNWSNTLNYRTTIGDDHRINIIAGTEAIENRYEWMNASRTDFFSTDPNYMQLSSGEDNQLNSGSQAEWSLFSLFGRVNYDLLGRYLFEVTVRRDGSSRFGPENRFATFPAASFAWNISREDFMTGTRDWLDMLKLRLGWGLAGNDRIGNYATYSTFATHQSRSAYPIGGTGTPLRIGFQPTVRGNPDVTWETTETYNLGLDFIGLGNTVNFSVDLWERNTRDMLYQVGVPATMGIATPPYINIGKMKNRGFDIELGYNNSALSGQFRYGISGTISRYVNEIVKLSDDIEEEIVFSDLRQMYYTRTTVGRAFPEYYGYIVDGIFQTQEEADTHPRAFGEEGDYNKPGRFKYRDITGSGYIDAADQTYIGSPHPDFTGGLNIDLGYGGFDLNLFFYGSYGNDMINYHRRSLDYGSFNVNRSRDALYNSWGSPYLDNNADAKLAIQDMHTGSQLPSTHYIEDGSFLRLQNLRLSYSVPERYSTRMQIQRLRLFAQVTNLFTITNYSGLDPDLDLWGGHMGIDQGSWPTPRRIMIGVNLNL